MRIVNRLCNLSPLMNGERELVREMLGYRWMRIVKDVSMICMLSPQRRVLLKNLPSGSHCFKDQFSLFLTNIKNQLVRCGHFF